MDVSGVPTTWAEYIIGGMVAALMWVVRGYAVDVKKLKENYMSRDETMAALATHQASTTAAFATLQASVDARHIENTANFRELRLRLDTLNDTMLKVALK